MLKWAALFGVAVFAGFVGTRMRPEVSSLSPASEIPSKTRDRTKPWKSDDFLEWVREKESGKGYSLTPNPVSEELKAWSDEELRAALDGALADASSALSNGRASTVIGWLIQEWMSRDPDAVVAWFEGLGAESKKRRLASWLGAHWPKERGEDGLALVIRNREFFDPPGAISSWAFVQLAIESAAQRGPAALDAVLAQLRIQKLDPRYGNPGSFPKGFDFSALAASPAAAAFLAEGNAFFAGEWMKEDPEEAFEYFKATLTLEDRNGVGKLFDDVLPRSGDLDPDAATGRAEWLASKLNTIEPADRRKIALDTVKALWEHPAVAGGFVAALEDPDDRLEASRVAATSVFERGIEPAMEFFEATGDARRLELLETATIGQPEWKTWMREKDERLLRERLAAWNASQERIDAIVRSMKEVTE